MVTASDVGMGTTPGVAGEGTAASAPNLGGQLASVSRVPKAGGSPELLATVGGGYATSIATDGANVYVAMFGSGADAGGYRIPTDARSRRSLQQRPATFHRASSSIRRPRSGPLAHREVSRNARDYAHLERVSDASDGDTDTGTTWKLNIALGGHLEA